MYDYDSYPMQFDSSSLATPEVMLAMSNDHQLYFAAYTDYDDLNDDGIIDDTYDNTIIYYGYFEHTKCYRYDSSNNLFTAEKFANIDENNNLTTFSSFNREDLTRENIYCNRSTGGARYWSGNFLNWVSMTRIDIVRKILYGGFRSTDSTSDSILERSYLPNDAHSFAKYYNGDDLNKLTPYTSKNTGDPIDSGMTFCNTTLNTSKGKKSQDIESPPLLRAVYGNFTYWAANERWQCLKRGKAGTEVKYYYDEDSGQALADPNPNEPTEMIVWRTSGAQMGANANWGEYDRLADDPLLATFLNMVNAHHDAPSLGPYEERIYEDGDLEKTTDFSADEGVDMVVRVRACDNAHTGELNTSQAMFGTEKCLKYPGSTYKPIGLLQLYGKDGEVLWGLMSGSYTKNKSGGILRKNIGDISDEINADGTFKFGDPFGSTAPTNGGIISTLNAFRIVDWTYNWDDNASYIGTYNQSGCWWGMTSFDNGECRNWGNPFGEILLESYRYFTDVNDATDAFDTDDSESGTALGLLSSVTWNHDATTTLSANSCLKASFNVIGFNASSVSYDSDEMSIATLTAAGTDTPNESVSHYTSLVGQNEGINGTTRFVGSTTANSTDANQCSSKLVSDLSTVSGTCPEAARLQGSYLAAGAAYYAKNFDINPAPGKQTITTYSVSLAPALPRINVAVPDALGNDTNRFINILPACKNGDSNCAIVDVKVLGTSTGTESGVPVKRGTYHIVWEDSEQGGDFDQDFAGILHYDIYPSKVRVKTRMISKSGGFDIGFGFVISGVSSLDNYNGETTGLSSYPAEGFHVTTGINDFEVPNQDDEKDWGFAEFTPSATANDANFLENPLYYAAKWGGYPSVDEDGTVHSTPLSWDRYDNNDGTETQDQIPDNFFSVVNPARLESQLDKVLKNILSTTTLSRATGVVSNAGNATGITVHALYDPELSHINEMREEQKVNWVGKLNAYFKDEFGFTREDSNSNGTLDNSDSVLQFEVVKELTNHSNAEVSKMRVFKYSFADYLDYTQSLKNWYANGKTGNEPTKPTPQDIIDDIEELSPIWNAQKELRKVNQLTNNRAYTQNTRSGRYIFTAVDKDGDGLVSHEEEEAFTLSVFHRDEYETYLHLSTEEEAAVDDQEAENLVDYIRGNEMSKYRNRTLNGTKWILGDIVNSTPEIVSAPNFNYDIEFGDETYAAYREKWKDRRQVVYAGANDGMLHAFNGGKCQIQSDKVTIDSADQRLFKLSCDNNETNRPLGGELWAYIPYNSLPHLKWLADKDYTHVPFVDGSIKHYDVNIFPNDIDHPGGWGTILVAGMRLGGGPYTIQNPETGSNQTLSSSYMIFDVTNPDKAPKLIAEFNHPSLGFTSVKTDIVKYRKEGSNGSYSDNDAENKWYLTFGSGPNGSDAYENMASTQEASIFLLDLELNSNFTLKNPDLIVRNTGLSNSFVGGINAMDWNRDYKEDVIYFGTVSGTPLAPSGSLQRQKLDLTNNTPWDGTNSQVINVNRPFSTTPLAAMDGNFNAWVVAGTGRLFVTNDGNYSSVGEAMYAVKENISQAGVVNARTVSVSTLANVSNAAISKTNSLEINSSLDTNAGVNLGLSGATNVKTRYDAAVAIQNANGWYEVFPNGERNHISSVMNSTTLFYATYNPEATCESGNSYIYARDLSTGLPKVYPQTGLSLGESEVGKLELEDVRITGLSGREYVDSMGGEKQIDTPSYGAASGRQGWREHHSSPNQ